MYKVDADGGDVGFSVCVICKSKKKTRLSNSTVSYEKKSVTISITHGTRVKKDDVVSGGDVT